MKQATPSLDDLDLARRTFEANEPRDLFYRAATELVDMALRGVGSLSVGESLAVLLRTWNASYYQFRQPFDSTHIGRIEDLISQFLPKLTAFRLRVIGSFCDMDRPDIAVMFQEFEVVLGPVGAAKALHLLAPAFFPLWDRAIAMTYVSYLLSAGQNGQQYLKFMGMVQEQVIHIVSQGVDIKSAVKRLDEYNYCRYTKKWSMGSY